MIYNRKQDQFKVIQFLNESKSTDSIKPLFTFMFVRTKDNVKQLMTTDSRQLHLYNDTDNIFNNIEDGFYDIRIIKSEAIISKADFDGQFPNVDQVIPKYKEIKSVKIRYSKDTYSSKAVAIINKELIDRKENAFINVMFVNSALKHVEDADAYITSGTSAVVFETGNFMSLVMPMEHRYNH